jgi:hypothetical protein
MPINQRDFLMTRKDAIFNPDKTTKPRENMNARQLRRLEQRNAKKNTNDNKSKHK